MVRKSIVLLATLFTFFSVLNAKVLLKLSGGRGVMKTVTKNGFMSSSSRTFRDENDRFVSMDGTYGTCFLDIQVPGEKEPADLIIPGVDPEDFAIGEGVNGGTFMKSSTVNGKTTSSTSYIWSYQLTPKKPGNYIIGPVEGTYDGKAQTSNTLKLKVYTPEEYQQIAGIAESVSHFTARLECPKRTIIPGERITIAIVVEYVGTDRLRCRFPTIKSNGLYVLDHPRDEERIMVDGKQGWRFTQHYGLVAEKPGVFTFHNLSVVGKFSQLKNRKLFTGDELRISVGSLRLAVQQATEKTADDSSFRCRLYWDKDEVPASEEVLLFFEMESDESGGEVERLDPQLQGGHLVFLNENIIEGEEGDPFAYKIIRKYLFRPSVEGTYRAYGAEADFIPEGIEKAPKSDVFSFDTSVGWDSSFFDDSFLNFGKTANFGFDEPAEKVKITVVANEATIVVGEEYSFMEFFLWGIIALLLLIMLIGSLFLMRQQKTKKR